MAILNVENVSLLASLLLVNLGIAVIVSLMFIARFKQKQRIEIKKLQASLNVLSSGSLGMGQRMIALEQKINALRSSQEELKQSNVDFSYTQAQKLIEQGVDGKTVAANSGLSSSEIQLMQLLHNTSKKPQHVSFG